MIILVKRKWKLWKVGEVFQPTQILRGNVPSPWSLGDPPTSHHITQEIFYPLSYGHFWDFQSPSRKGGAIFLSKFLMTIKFKYEFFCDFTGRSSQIQHVKDRSPQKWEVPPHFFSKITGPPTKTYLFKNYVPQGSWGRGDTMDALVPIPFLNCQKFSRFHFSRGG